MADQERVPVLTPQELLVKSNPGIFDKDLTNPRDIYSMLATRTRSTEDLSIKLKHELAKGSQTQNVFPKLYRTVSLRDIKKSTANPDELGLYHSNTELLSPRRQVNVLLLTGNRTSIDDLRRVDVERKENLKTLNLPNITRNVISHEGAIQESFTENVALPNVGNGQHVATEAEPELGENPASPKKKKSRIREDPGPPDAKLEKWFSEMPNEVFDKAQRALMAETIKDKLQMFQQKRIKKDKRHQTLHAKIRKVPNTFLELRVDSFGRHLQVDNKEKLAKYKLQQKSLHKLKMREMEEGARPHLEDFDSPRLGFVQQRSNTNVTKRTTPEEKTKKIVKPVNPDKSLKTVNMNDVALDGALKPNPRIVLTKFEEYNDRFNVYKAGPSEGVSSDGTINSRQEERGHQVPNSLDSREADRVEVLALEKELTKASIVNLALRKSSPKKRRPIHIMQSIEIAETMMKENADDNSDDDLEDIDSNNDQQADDESDNRNRQGHIIATIPTAKSNRTNDSKSTSSSTKSQKPKEVLRRFNRLEVFSENIPTSDAEMVRTNYRGQKRRDMELKDENPLNYKLDLKQYPNRHPVPENGELGLPEVRVQEVVFRFEPGEVYITRKNNLSLGRASERARIIYGKAVSKDDKKDETRRMKENRSLPSSKTATTKLDGYVSELARFETRALAADSTSFDPQDERGLTRSSHRLLPSAAADIDEDEYNPRGRFLGEIVGVKTPFGSVSRNGKIVKDISTETDVLGPQENGQAVFEDQTGEERRLSDNNPNDENGLGEDELEQAIADRPQSNLSDFIKDDDTGEGLDSDIDAKSSSTSIKMFGSDRGTSAG